MEKISNTLLENKIFTTRLVFASLFMLILVSILVLVIYNLQITNHQHYTQEAFGNQISTVPINPTRGKIFDRNGKILATNQLSYRLTITPEKTKDIKQTMVSLQQFGLINDTDIQRFYKHKKRYKKFHNIPIKHKLSETQIAKFLVSNQFIGTNIEPYFHRIYPQQNTAVHALGYIGRINKKDKFLYDKKKYSGTFFVGKTGIEKQYETLLHGTSGVKQIERNVSGRVVDSKIIIPAIAGSDLFLTLDLNLQKAAQSLLKNKRGAIVVIDVKSGEVLVLASAPTYNPNHFVSGMSNKDYQKLKNSKDIPQLNRAIQGLYPPGSTIKPMIALAGLEADIINDKTTAFCPGYFKLKNVSRKFNDWKRTGHGKIDAQNSIAQSCDVFFYSLANKMGIDLIHKHLNFFNFGKKTKIDIPNEQSGILPSKAWKKSNKKLPWYQGETLITGIGQGFISSTPLQLATATAALANKGHILQPKLLKSTQLNTQPIKEIPTAPSKQIPIKDIKNWDYVINGMKKTIYATQGTARRINKNLNYTLAGKTGTAQIFGLDPEEQYIAEKYPEHLRDHALFVGFAPIENPQIAIAVIVENAGSGSAKAAPLARKVLDLYFKRPLHK